MKSFLIFVEDENGLFYHKDMPGKKFRMVANKHNQDPIEVIEEDKEQAYEKVRTLSYARDFYEIPEKDLFKKFHLERYR